MKLATYKDGSRNGQLVVVSRDLSTAHYATGVAHTLQQALDDWNFIAPQLQDLYVTLNQGKARHTFNFDPRMCMAPLPRPQGHLWAGEPPVPARSEGWRGAVADLHWPQRPGVQTQAALAVALGDLAPATPADEALESVRLLALMHAVVAPLWPGDARRWPLGAAFAPVAVTPDEAGPAWAQGRLHLPLQLQVDGQRARTVDASSAPWGLGEVLAQACRDVGLGAGAVVGLPVAEVQVEPLRPTSDTATDAASDAEPACLTVRLEVRAREGVSLFGALDHAVLAQE